MQNISAQNFNLKIEGKSNEETSIIDSVGYQKSHLNFKSINYEIDSLKIKLHKIGYLQNQVLKTEKENDSSFITYLNLKEKTNTIYIYYKQNEVSKDIIKLASSLIKEDYFILPLTQVEPALNLINSEIIKQGLPFSSLKLSEIQKGKNNNLEANLLVNRNLKSRVTDDIIIKGYEKFPRSFLKHYLKIKKGDVFDLEEIKTKIKKIDNLPFTSKIKPPEVLFTKDTTSLYLYLEKNTSNTFDGFLGFGTNEDTNKIEFDGYLNLRLINNLNFGESLDLIYKSDENDQKNFNVNANLPYLFKTPLGTELNLNIFKRDSTFTITNQSAKLFYQINSKNSIALGINSIQSEDLLNNNNSALIEDYETSFYTVSYSHLNRQNFNRLFNINSLLEFEIGFGNRDLNQLSYSQSIFKLNAFKIFNLNDKNSIYVRINSSGLFSDNYLENELFRFGGINSIRGFKENSILSSIYGVINTEYRYQLDQNIYVHSIFDASYYENENLNIEEKLFGFGFGFGILTKSGLLKFIYANGKQEDSNFKFQNSKIHLSITSRF